MDAGGSESLAQCPWRFRKLYLSSFWKLLVREDGHGSVLEEKDVGVLREERLQGGVELGMKGRVCRRRRKSSHQGE